MAIRKRSLTHPNGNPDGVPLPPPDVFLDLYGQCLKVPCSCLREGWEGMLCPHWQPDGATSFEEMIARIAKGSGHE